MNELTMAEKEKMLTNPNKSSRGLENLTDSSEIIIPRAKKIEAMSPEMQDADLLAKGIRPGVIINNITKEILSEKFVPIKYYKRFIRFNANKEGDRGWVDGHEPRGVIYQTRDVNDFRLVEDTKWDGDLPPLTTTYHCFLSLFEGQTTPIELSFGGTNFKAGKTLLSLAALLGGDLFSKQYKLTTKKHDKPAVYFTLEVSLIGKAPESEYLMAEQMYQRFSNISEIQIHEDEPGSNG